MLRLFQNNICKLRNRGAIMDSTDQILRELCDNTRNATIEACCKAVHIACRAEAPNATAQELGEIIIRRLRNLKTEAA